MNINRPTRPPCDPCDFLSDSWLKTQVVFRPLSMDERPSVVIGLLALWTGPKYVMFWAWVSKFVSDRHVRFLRSSNSGFCQSSLQQRASFLTRFILWWHNAWSETQHFAKLNTCVLCVSGCLLQNYLIVGVAVGCPRGCSLSHAGR